MKELKGNPISSRNIASTNNQVVSYSIFKVNFQNFTFNKDISSVIFPVKSRNFFATDCLCNGFVKIKSRLVNGDRVNHGKSWNRTAFNRNSRNPNGNWASVIVGQISHLLLKESTPLNENNSSSIHQLLCERVQTSVVFLQKLFSVDLIVYLLGRSYNASYAYCTHT